MVNDVSSGTVKIDESEIAWLDDKNIYDKSKAPGTWLDMTDGICTI